MPPFWNVGNQALVLCKVLMGQRPDLSETIELVRSQHGLDDIRDIRNLLGKNWWTRLREPLLRVVLPLEYYQVWNWQSGAYQWDDLGFRAYCRDLSLYPNIPTNDRRQRLSQFLFYFEVGKSWNMKTRKACKFARGLLERSTLGCQQRLPFKATRRCGKSSDETRTSQV
jgi:hypothetical protein